MTRLDVLPDLVPGRTGAVGPSRGRRPPGARRGHVALALFAVALVAFGTLVGVEYARLRARLTEERAVLAEARGALGSARLALKAKRAELAVTRARHGAALKQTAARVAERDLLETGREITGRDLIDATLDLTSTEVAVFFVALRANEVTSCLDGVAAATGSLAAGEEPAAVEALRAAAVPCDTVLASVSGARFPFDFADPFVLRVGSTYYGYSTNAGAGDIQVIRSDDLLRWEVVGNGLAALAPWATPNRTWAPAVLSRQGRYVVYYTVEDAMSGRECISRAVSPTPEGPFVDDSTAPLVCPLDGSWAIDPSPFVDTDGSAWLTWKTNGAATGASAIWSQRLADDALTVVGTPSEIVHADRSWERGVVEGPSLLRDGDRYYLFYSGADWTTRTYAIGYAACAGPAGPCTKPPGGPLLASGPRLAGPGGQEAFTDADGRWWLAYHAYTEPNVGYPSSRTLHLARLHFGDAGPVIEADT